MTILSINQSLINPKAIEICQILNEHGHQAFIVGGCVRDLLLGYIPKDWDITTDASPQTIIKIFPKTYPTGLQHGTVTVSMGEGKDNHFEVTTFRIEGEYKDGRRPEEVFFVMDVVQDLARRDLTINSIAYDPIANQIIDPFGGYKDLENGEIKAVGKADARFKEDGLRIMRAARFAARFNYEIQQETFEAMYDNLDILKKVSKERIQDELNKILMTDNVIYGLHILNECGALKIACPLLFKNSKYIVNENDEFKGDLTTRLAILYSSNYIKDVQEELINLKYSNKDIRQTLFILELFERYITFIQKDNNLSYKSFMAAIKNHSIDSWEYTFEQFKIFLNGIGMSSNRFNKYKNEIVLTRKEMSINGNDLMSVGISAGPELKNLLDMCYLEILKNPEHNNKEYLTNFAINEQIVN